LFIDLEIRNPKGFFKNKQIVINVGTRRGVFCHSQIAMIVEKENTRRIFQGRNNYFLKKI
jgi:hypothetical protein